jgi:hypothetical protein
MIEGTFTGFLQSLTKLDISFMVEQRAGSVVIRVARLGKQAQVELPRAQIIDATSDVASAELGEIINALL